MEPAYGAYEPNTESGKTNIATLVIIGTGLLALAGTATLIKVGCDKYLPQFYNYIYSK